MKTAIAIMVLALLVVGISQAWATDSFDYAGFKAEMQKERQVKDLLITDAGNIYVGMLDNGSDRRGYAMYVCEVAREFASSSTQDKLIRVIDIAKVVQKKGFHTLGKTNCTF